VLAESVLSIRSVITYPLSLRTALHDDLTRAPTAHPSWLDGDGCLPVPQEPGLGIEVNREAFARLAIH
jgi:L-alanine-DL-glutamate epimerase-like enolase superfamily enzyme